MTDRLFENVALRAADSDSRSRALAEAAYNARVIPATYHALAAQALAQGDDERARDFTAKAAAARAYWLAEAGR